MNSKKMEARDWLNTAIEKASHQTKTASTEKNLRTGQREEIWENNEGLRKEREVIRHGEDCQIKERR